MNKRSWALVCLLAILLGSVAVGATANTDTSRYMVGYGIRDINPWVDPADHSKGVLPVELTGNGNDWDRVCQGFMDDNGDGVVGEGDGLFTTATAVTDPYGKTVIYITIDSLQGYALLTRDSRSAIVEALGPDVISGDQIMVNGNHTHSGPYFAGLKSHKDEAFKAYYQYTVQQITDAAVEAYNDRAEAIMTKGAIDAKESTAHLGYKNGEGYHMNAIRHYNYTSQHKTISFKKKYHVAGSNFGNMGTTMSDYKRIGMEKALESDNTMYLLLFEFPNAEEKEPVVFVNWRAHSTGNSGIDKTKVSADYANSLRVSLKKAGYRAAFFQGASGNVVTTSNTDKDWENECLNRVRDLNVYGRMLCEVALDCIDRKMTDELPAGRIRTLQKTYHGEIQKDSEGLLAAAIAYQEGSEALGEHKFLPLPFKYEHTDGQTYILNSRFHANCIVTRSKAAESYTDLELNVIIMGDNVAFVTAPNELADRFDLAGSTKDEDNDWYELIDEATYGMPFVLGYTNDGRGYIPFSLEYAYNTYEYYEITGKGLNGDEFHGAGSYEANTSRFARGTGEDIVQTFKQMLEEIDELCYLAECKACNKEVEWKPIIGVNTGTLSVVSGHHYLYQDLPMGTLGVNRVSLKSGNVLCLDLKGHKMETPSRSFYLEGTAKLNLFDSVGTGHVISFPGGNNVGGGTVLVGSGATFNIYGGTLQFVHQELPEGTFQTGNGAVISCGGTTNMYGGTLVGGQLSMSSYYGPESATNGCGGTAYITGRFNAYGGRIIAGKAAEGGQGDCVYLPSSSGRITVYNDAVIDEIYINQNSGSQLVVNGVYTGKLAVKFAPSVRVYDGVDIGNLANKPNASDADITCANSGCSVATSGTNLILQTNAAAVGEDSYDDLQSALDAADGKLVIMRKPVAEEIAISKDTSIDLNGCSITGKLTVADGMTLYCMDSATDDYSVSDKKYGRLTKVNGTVAAIPEESELAQDGYLMITENGETSFHRVNLQITAMNLRASETGIYYVSKFACDAMAAKYVSKFGVALSIQAVPTLENLKKDCVLSSLDGFCSGGVNTNVTGTLLKGVMKSENPETENAANVQIQIYGRAYVLLSDGSYMFGAPVNRSFQEQVEEIDLTWSKLTEEQQTGLVELYNAYGNVMGTWNIPNIVTAATTPVEPTPEETPVATTEV